MLAGPLSVDGAAAVVLTVGIGLLPAYPLLAIRLGRLPLAGATATVGGPAGG